MMSVSTRVKVLSLLGITAILVTLLHSAVVGLPTEGISLASSSECSNGIDDDNDGYADYPVDPECLSAGDDSESTTNGPVSVVVTDSQSNAFQGESLTYHITVRSEAGSPSNENIKFYIPDFVDVTNVSDNGLQRANVVEWNQLFIHPDTPRTLSVNVLVRNTTVPGSVLLAEAEVVGESIAADQTVVLEEEILHTPLYVTVDDGKTFVNPDEEVHYQIFVENPAVEDKDFTLKTTLPPHLSFVSATGEYSREQRELTWKNQFAAPGETVVYDVYAIVERDTAHHTTLTMKAHANGTVGQDATTVIAIDDLPPGSLAVSVNDYLSEAAPGDEITYDIVLENRNATLATGVDVTNAMPIYTEFVSATEGGQWTGKDVHWTGLTVSPRGKRTLQVTLRVRSDAPINADLSNRVQAGGQTAVDLTYVSLNSSHVVSQSTPVRGTLLRKIADRRVVNPGDMVFYTISVRNTFDHVLENIRIEDRMNPAELQVTNAEHGELVGNSIVWMVPSLLPGEEWSVRYGARVQPGVPQGADVTNVVTISGNGLETLSLTERVRTAQIGVVTELPRSGAPLDVILAIIMSLMGTIPAALHRKGALLLS